MELKKVGRLRAHLDMLAHPRRWPDKDALAYLISLFNEDSLDFLSWAWSPTVEYAEVGSNPDWRCGAVTEAGWYTMPYCDPGCCRPRGPFSNKEDAILDYRRCFVASSLRKGIKVDIEKLIHPVNADDRSDDT